MDVRHTPAAMAGSIQPQGGEPGIDFFEMEVHGAEFLQFARTEMGGDFRIGVQLAEEVGVVTTGVLDRPGLHGRALDQ